MLSGLLKINMKRNGFISVIALFIMAFILTSSLFLLYLTKLQTSIFTSSYNKLQSQYISEAKIYKVLHHEKYYKNQLEPRIHKQLRGLADLDPKEIILDSADLEDWDKNNKVYFSFYRDNDKRYLELVSKTIYNNIETSSIARIALIDEMFEFGIPILSWDFLDEKWYEYLENFIINLKENIDIEKSNLPSAIEGYTSIGYNKVILKKDGVYSKADFFIDEEGLNNHKFKKNEVFLVLKDVFDRSVTLEVGDSSFDEALKLSGILYVDGDMIIKSQFTFNGIIVLNNGNLIIDTNSIPEINGIILIKGGSIDFDSNYLLKYDISLIYRYGTYLPGFLNPKIIVLKKY